MTDKIVNFGGLPVSGEKSTPDFLHMTQEQFKEKVKSVKPEELSHMAHALTQVISREKDKARLAELHALEQSIIDEHKRRLGKGEQGISQATRTEDQGSVNSEKRILGALITSICRYIGVEEGDGNFLANIEKALSERGFDAARARGLATQIVFAKTLVEGSNAVHDKDMLRGRIVTSTQSLTDFLEEVSQNATQPDVSGEGEEGGDEIQDALELSRSREFKAYARLQSALSSVTTKFFGRRCDEDTKGILSNLTSRLGEMPPAAPLSVDSVGVIEEAAATCIKAERILHREWHPGILKEKFEQFTEENLVERCSKSAIELEKLLKN